MGIRMYRDKIIIIILIAIVASLALANPIWAQLRCSDVTYGNENYDDKMDELAQKANLPDNYWNKYHALFVSELCKGNIKDLDQLVRDRYVKAQEAQNIARVLGKTYKPKK